jgi:hypothetical protein
MMADWAVRYWTKIGTDTLYIEMVIGLSSGLPLGVFPAGL